MTADTPSPSPRGSSLLTQMRPALLKFFMRKTGSGAEAEDLTQDVLMRALAHARWETPEDAKGYLFRTAVNRWRDYQRKLRGRGQPDRLVEDLEEYAGSENTPDHVLVVREDLNQGFEALEAMHERTRTVLVLIQVEQMKTETVAEMLGISARAVRKHLAKGIETLMRLRKRQEWIR